MVFIQKFTFAAIMNKSVKLLRYIFMLTVAFVFLAKVVGFLSVDTTEVEQECRNTMALVDMHTIDDASDKATINLNTIKALNDSDLSLCFSSCEGGLQYHFAHTEEYTFLKWILFEADTSPPMVNCI